MINAQKRKLKGHHNRILIEERVEAGQLYEKYKSGTETLMWHNRSERTFIKLGNIFRNL